MNTSAGFITSPGRALAGPVALPQDEGLAWSGGLRILRRRARLIGAILLLICLAALPVILGMPKRYYAETRVLVSPAPALSLTAGLDGREVGVDMEAELERFLSKDVTNAVVERFDLMNNPEFNPALTPPTWLDTVTGTLRGVIAGPAAEGAAGSDDPAEEKVARTFGEVLLVSRRGNVDMITVGFSARDPALVAAVPQAVVDTYLAQRTARWQLEVSGAVDWLERRILAERGRVAAIRAELDQLVTQALPAGDGAADTASGRRAQVAARQFEVERERFELAATRSSIAIALGRPEMPVASEPEGLEVLRGELRAEIRELNRIALIYGDNHNAVQRQKDRIDALRAEIVTALGAFDRSLGQRDAALAAEQARLSAEAETAREELSAIQEAAPQLEERRAALRSQEKTLADLEYRRQVLLSQAQLAPVSLEVLAPAQLPHDPIGPSRKMAMLATALGGLLVALTAAALVELRDTGTRSHEQLTHLPQLQPVGLWPKFSFAQKRSMMRDIAAHAPTPAAETLRETLLMLESLNGGALPQLLTVAGPRTEDMPVPVAEWIASEIAAMGHEVQLVETRPAPARSFLQMSGGGKAAPVPQERLSRRSLTDLVAQCGGDVSAALRALTEEAAESHCITVIDAPPLLAQGSLRFARFGGTMLLVLRWGHTPRAVVELAAGLLAKLGGPQVFSLITDVRPRRHRLYGFTDRLTVAPSGRAGAAVYR